MCKRLHTRSDNYQGVDLLFYPSSEILACYYEPSRHSQAPWPSFRLFGGKSPGIKLALSLPMIGDTAGSNASKIARSRLEAAKKAASEGVGASSPCNRHTGRLRRKDRNLAHLAELSLCTSVLPSTLHPCANSTHQITHELIVHCCTAPATRELRLT